MIKTLQNTLKQDKEIFTVPRSVQDIIPIRRIWPDGVFQFGSKYSKTLRFSDINYAIASKEDKTAMFLSYSELLNALDTGSTTKITINNKRLDRRNFEQEILIPPKGDDLDGGRKEYNAMLLDKVTDSSNSVVQERYITLSVHKKNVEEARAFFDRTVHDASSRLNHMDSHCEEMDAADRLHILHDFYRVGEESEFRFDLRENMKNGHSFKDAICPDSMEFKKDHFIMGGKYGRVLFLKEYASYIKDSMINELTSLNRSLMLSIDIIPVPTDEAVREMQNRLLGVETNVTNWQRRQNANNNFSAVVPYVLEQQRKETREIKLYAGLALYRVGETSDTDLDWALREDNLATQCAHIYGMGYDGFALFRYAYLKENGTQVELQNLYSYLKKQAGILTSEVDAGIVYTVHMQTFGWQEAKMDGIVAGYTKQEKSVEAVRIQLGAYVPKGNVRYAVETAQGQSAWRKDGEQAGSVGQKEPLLGIRINLTGGISDSYDILYRVYVSAQGWTDWGKNGTYTGGGTIQALQVKLVKKAE